MINTQFFFFKDIEGKDTHKAVVSNYLMWEVRHVNRSQVHLCRDAPSKITVRSSGTNIKMDQTSIHLKHTAQKTILNIIHKSNHMS